MPFFENYRTSLAAQFTYGKSYHPKLTDSSIYHKNKKNNFPGYYNYLYHAYTVLRVICMVGALPFLKLYIDFLFLVQRKLLIWLDILGPLDALTRESGAIDFFAQVPLFLSGLILSLLICDRISLLLTPKSLYDYFILSDYLRYTKHVTPITSKHWEGINPEELKARSRPALKTLFNISLILLTIVGYCVIANVTVISTKGNLIMMRPFSLSYANTPASEFKRASLSFTTSRDKYDNLVINPSLLLEQKSGQSHELWSWPFPPSQEELLKALTALKHAGVSISVQTMPTSFDEQTDSYFVDTYLFLQEELRKQ